jgi:hypothetical protein
LAKNRRSSRYTLEAMAGVPENWEDREGACADDPAETNDNNNNTERGTSQPNTNIRIKQRPSQPSPKVVSRANKGEQRLCSSLEEYERIKAKIYKNM